MWDRWALSQLDSDSSAAPTRADLFATLRTTIRVLAADYDPATLTASPGHARIAAATGRHVRTVSRAIDRLEALGVISIRRVGSITLGASGVEKWRQEYRLLVPPRIARDYSPEPAVRRVRSERGQPRARWSLGSVPRSRRDRRLAAERMQREWIGLRGCSARALAAALREWFAAGWSPYDVRAALDFRPDDTAWTYTTAARDVVALVRYRLSYWLDEGGRPMPSPAQRGSADRRERARAAAAREREAVDLLGASQIGSDARRALEAARSLVRSQSRARRRGAAVARSGDEARKVVREPGRLRRALRNVAPTQISTSRSESQSARERAGSPLTPDQSRWRREVGSAYVAAKEAARCERGSVSDRSAGSVARESGSQAGRRRRGGLELSSRLD